MINKSKISLYLVIVIQLAIIIFCLRSCGDEKTLRLQEEHNHVVNLQGFKRVMTKKDQTITKQEQIITSSKELAEEMIEENETLKKVNQQVKYRTQTVYRDIKVPVVKFDTIHLDDRIKRYILQRKWFDISISSGDSAYLMIDSMRVFSEPVVSFGYEHKKKLSEVFKKRKAIVTITDKNPYVEVLEMSNITVEDKTNKINMGFSAGYGITPVGFQPYFGYGFNIKLIGK